MEDVISRRMRETLGDTRGQCTATSKQSGERCRRAPIPGGSVCVMHGGGIPAVREAARERLLMLVEPAMEVLYRATRQAPPCEVCGRSDADRDPTAVRAAGMILDRTGFGPKVTIEAATPEPPPYLAWVPHDKLQLISEILAEARLAMERGDRPALPPPIRVDAVLVESDPGPAGTGRR